MCLYLCLLNFEKSIDKHCVFFKNIYLSLFLKRIKGVPSLIQLRWEEMGKGPHSEAYACLTFVCTSDCVETLGVATYTARPTETKPEKKKGGRRQRNSISQLIVFFLTINQDQLTVFFYTKSTPISQQYFSLTTNHHQPPSHSQANTAEPMVLTDLCPV